MKLNDPIAFSLLFGPESPEYNGLTFYRGKEPSYARIALIELAVVGCLLLAAVELVVRGALTGLTYLPCLITKKSRKFHTDKLAAPTLLSLYTLKYGPQHLIKNLTGPKTP